MVHGRADVETLNPTAVPRTARGPFCMGNDAAAGWSHRGGIVVERSIEELPCRLGRIEF